MRSSFKYWTIALTVIGVFACMFAPVARAADNNDNSQLVNLDLTDVDVKTAIKMLFQTSSKNYTIDPDVSGTIPSASLKNVTFDAALKTLVKSAGLTYSQDNGVYIIRKKQAVTTPVMPTPVDQTALVDTTTVEEETIEKVPLSNTGASEILDMMNGNKSSGSSSNGFGNYGTFNSNLDSGSSFGSNSSFGNSSSSRSSRSSSSSSGYNRNY